MPHWYGIVSTQSPPFITGCQGDKLCVKRAILEHAPTGANVRTFNWPKGKNVVAITVEGPGAKQYLDSLGATDVVELDETAPV
jgi:hypothetical protein